MRQLARITFVVLATVAMLVFLWRFRNVLLLLLMAITIATLVAPGIRRLSRRGLPRMLAIGVVYGALFVVSGLVLWTVSGSLLAEWEQIVTDVDKAHRYIQRHWTAGSALERYVAEFLPPVEDLPQPVAPAADGTVVRSLLGIGGSVFSLAIAGFLTIVVSIYWSIDYWRIERLWLLLLPLGYRVRARRIWHRIQFEVGTYMRSRLLLAALAGMILGIAFRWSDFPYPVTVAAAVSLTWLVPWLGPGLAVAAVWAASQLHFSDFTVVATLARSAIASGFTLLVFVFLEFAVQPRVLPHRRYSWLLVLLVTVALLQWIGVAALVLGAPVAIAIQVLLGRLLYRGAEDGLVHQPNDIGSLRERLGAIRQRLGQVDDAHALALSNVVQRLDQLLSDAEPALQQGRSEAAADSPASPPRDDSGNGTQPQESDAQGESVVATMPDDSAS